MSSRGVSTDAKRCSDEVSAFLRRRKLDRGNPAASPSSPPSGSGVVLDEFDLTHAASPPPATAGQRDAPGGMRKPAADDMEGWEVSLSLDASHHGCRGGASAGAGPGEGDGAGDIVATGLVTQYLPEDDAVVVTTATGAEVRAKIDGGDGQRLEFVRRALPTELAEAQLKRTLEAGGIGDGTALGDIVSRMRAKGLNDDGIAKALSRVRACKDGPSHDSSDDDDDDSDDDSDGDDSDDDSDGDDSDDDSDDDSNDEDDDDVEEDDDESDDDSDDNEEVESSNCSDSGSECSEDDDRRRRKRKSKSKKARKREVRAKLVMSWYDPPQVRAVDLRLGSSQFKKLARRLRGEYGFAVAMTYRDDEGDDVTIRSQRDLHSALRWALGTGHQQRGLRITLTRVDASSAPDADAPRRAGGRGEPKSDSAPAQARAPLSPLPARKTAHEQDAKLSPGDYWRPAAAHFARQQCELHEQGGGPGRTRDCKQDGVRSADADPDTDTDADADPELRREPDAQVAQEQRAPNLCGRPPLLPRRGSWCAKPITPLGARAGAGLPRNAASKDDDDGGGGRGSDGSDAARPGKPGFRWQRGQLLGRGSFGKVYAGLNLCTAETFAVKLLKLGNKAAAGASHGGTGNRSSRGKTDAELRALEREIEVLRQLDHPNIVRYLGVERAADGSRLSIFLEFCSGGSVSQALRKFGAFSEAVIRRYVADTVRGLAYLHAQNIIHRDVKGGNLLIDRGVVKLADFGCSKVTRFMGEMSESQHTAVGTMQFMAPEVMKSQDVGGSSPSPRAHTPAARSSPELDIVVSDIDNSLEEIVEELDVCDDCKHGDDDEDEDEAPGAGAASPDAAAGTRARGTDARRRSGTAPGYGRKADIWSVGMAVIEMTTGRPPWPNPAGAIYKLCMTEELPPFPSALSSDGQAFLDLCLRRDPAARANAKSLLKHPFLEPKSDPAMLNATTAGVPEADDNWSTSASVVTRLGSVCSADAPTVDVVQSDGLESIGTQLDLDCSTQDNVAVACGDSNRTAKPVARPFWADRSTSAAIMTNK